MVQVTWLTKAHDMFKKKFGFKGLICVKESVNPSILTMRMCFLISYVLSTSSEVTDRSNMEQEACGSAFKPFYLQIF